MNHAILLIKIDNLDIIFINLITIQLLFKKKVDKINFLNKNHY